MKQFPRPAQASRKYFYFFIGLISLVVLMGLAGGASLRSVDSQRSAVDAKEEKLREEYKALFYDGPPTTPATATAKASDSQTQQSKSNPVTPSSVVCNTVSNTV